MFKWKLPTLPSDKCVLRIRYNISTDDYDPMSTFQQQNGNVDIASK
jgi:hypothetical protein